MVGVNGKKFPDIRQHLTQNIGETYKDMDLEWDPSDLFAAISLICRQI